VILNLAFNAVDALRDSQEPRVIRLVTERELESAVVRVLDTGPGVPKGAHDRLFDGFSSSKVGGNGIGLTLCKNIVTRHGGTIAATAVVPQGLECRFSLPLS
jgi:two-component system sensor kinase FixL